MANQKLRYKPLESDTPGFYLLLGGLGLVALIGFLAAHHMETEGHVITGMTNEVVWGLPHVFAVFLIVAASGALNVASISSVFGRGIYKPMARMSGIVAIALLAGGLSVLVLDLGRPDRLIIAMTYLNFKSIFAWNIILYNGFFLIVAVYLWMMMERKMNKFSKPAGMVAFLWRLILTTGTGSIFGFIVARQGYDAALLAPTFVVMSFSYGLALFLLIVMVAFNASARELGDLIVAKMRNLLGVFIASVLYFVAVYHLTNLYATEHHGYEAFVLAGATGGALYSSLFWLGQILIGSLIPLVLIYHPRFSGNRKVLALAAGLVILGGFFQMYVTIIGGQAYPLVLFPGADVTSSFHDGVVNSYAPSIWELLLGLGGVAVALLIVAVAFRVLPFMPNSLANAMVDPHHHKG
ncbi:MAG: NrfD/PsrC family molybdoenzyme membrane anchor subunit [Thiotrichales bacterium]